MVAQGLEVWDGFLAVRTEKCLESLATGWQIDRHLGDQGGQSLDQTVNRVAQGFR